MALVQAAGMSLSKVVVLVGAGVAGSVVLRNGRLAEILGELQEILEKGSKGKEGGEDGNPISPRRLPRRTWTEIAKPSFSLQCSHARFVAAPSI